MVARIKYTQPIAPSLRLIVRPPFWQKLIGKHFECKQNTYPRKDYDIPFLNTEFIFHSASPFSLLYAIVSPLSRKERDPNGKRSQYRHENDGRYQRHHALHCQFVAISEQRL